MSVRSVVLQLSPLVPVAVQDIVAFSESALVLFFHFFERLFASRQSDGQKCGTDGEDSPNPCNTNGSTNGPVFVIIEFEFFGKGHQWRSGNSNGSCRDELAHFLDQRIGSCGLLTGRKSGCRLKSKQCGNDLEENGVASHGGCLVYSLQVRYNTYEYCTLEFEQEACIIDYLVAFMALTPKDCCRVPIFHQASFATVET